MPDVVLTIYPKRDGHVRVRLPFRPGRENYRLIEDLLEPTRVRVEYDRSERVFTVPRSHAGDLIEGLAQEFGQVLVRQYGWNRVTCVSACWSANPDTAWDCECGCAGTNHGSKHPLKHIVDSELSVDGDYTLHEWIATSGWSSRRT